MHSLGFLCTPLVKRQSPASAGVNRKRLDFGISRKTGARFFAAGPRTVRVSPRRKGATGSRGHCRACRWRCPVALDRVCVAPAPGVIGDPFRKRLSAGLRAKGQPQPGSAPASSEKAPLRRIRIRMRMPSKKGPPEPQGRRAGREKAPKRRGYAAPSFIRPWRAPCP